MIVFCSLEICRCSLTAAGQAHAQLRVAVLLIHFSLNFHLMVGLFRQPPASLMLIPFQELVLSSQLLHTLYL